MVQVDSVTTPSNPKVNLSKPAKESSKSFSDFKTKEKKPTKTSTSKSQKLDAASMLALQEITGEQNDNQEMQQYGNKALSILRKLQLKLLSGALTIDELNDMQALLDNCPNPNSPSLKQLTGAIKTRIAVEIAKVQLSSK